MAESNQNLWAPWRMEYIRSLDSEQEEDGCFLCHYWAKPDQDRDNHVVWRGDTGFVVMNRFPYTNGHLMVACAEHKGELSELSEDELVGLTKLIRDAVLLLGRVVRAQGYNVGYNIGRCAGAGLPGHLHAHIVPRWSGDTNFMSVLGETRVVPDSLDALYDELIVDAKAAGFRS